MHESTFLNIHNLLSATLRRRYLIAVPILLMPIFGLIIGWFSPQSWETHTTILIQETSSLNPFLEDLSVSTNLEGRMAALKSLIHSRHILLSVGEDLGRINTDSNDRERYNLIEELSSSLTVIMEGKDLIKLSYSSEDPKHIAETLLAVRTRFLDNLLAPEISSINASEVFLQGQLDERRKALRESEQNLSNFKRRHASDLPDLHGANVTTLRDLKSTLAKHNTALAGALAAKESVRTRLVQVDPVIGRLEEQIAATTAELALLRARYTDNHSRVKGVKRQLRRLEKERSVQLKKTARLAGTDIDRLWQMADSIGRDDIMGNDNGGALLISQLQELQSADSRVKQLEQETSVIQEQLIEMDLRVANFGEVERAMSELERDLAVKRNLYSDLLERFERAMVTGALGRFEQPERIKIIDEPFTPRGPSNLPILFFIFSGLVGGLAIGIGMALIAEIMDTTVRSRESLLEILGVPVLSRIPNLAPQISFTENSSSGDNS